MLQTIYFWVLTGALGLFFGIPNPILHVPFAVLLYPASLYMLSKISNNPFRHGMLCGLIGVSFSMYWISVAVYLYGDFPLVLAIPCAIIFGVYIGAWGGIFSLVMRKMLCLGPLLRALSAALFWYICEWLISFLFTGFPWITLSSAFAPIPELIQGASLIGAFGLSGVFAGISVLFVESFVRYVPTYETQTPYTKNILYRETFYRGILSFGAVFLILVLFTYGNARLESSFDDNDFLYGADVEQTYITIERTLDGDRGSDIDNNTSNNPDSNTGDNIEANLNDSVNPQGYQEYHENPQKIGSSKHSFVLPNFVETAFDKESELLRIENNILVPKSFLEQDNIALFMAVQGNVSQAVKWEKPFQFATVQKYIRLSEEGLNFVENIFPFLLATPSIVLWPETALPFYFQQPSPLSSMVRNFAENQKILFGAPGFELDANAPETIDTYNRLFFLQSGDLSSYDKKHLVPFGEYVPEIPFLPSIFSNLLQGIDVFSVGKNEELLILKETNPSRKTVSHSLSSLICYEAIFPQIAREDVKKGAELFVNISNDAWYDKTSAAKQHLHLSLMRAVEQKRFLVRAGNTGISAFVDDYGRIMAQSDLFTDETLSAFVALRTEKTVYYHWAPYIPLFVFSLFLILFIYGQIWAIHFRKVRRLKQI